MHPINYISRQNRPLNLARINVYGSGSSLELNQANGGLYEHSTLHDKLHRCHQHWTQLDPTRGGDFNLMQLESINIYGKIQLFNGIDYTRRTVWGFVCRFSCYSMHHTNHNTDNSLGSPVLTTINMIKCEPISRPAR
jgi:hypothetical protein